MAALIELVSGNRACIDVSYYAFSGNYDVSKNNCTSVRNFVQNSSWIANYLPSLDHFGGPGRAIGPVCVCLCDRALTFE